MEWFVSEEMLDGLMWVFLVTGGLLVVFILVSLTMLALYAPPATKYQKGGFDGTTQK